jgi:hypothetical protein
MGWVVGTTMFVGTGSFDDVSLAFFLLGGLRGLGGIGTVRVRIGAADDEAVKFGAIRSGGAKSGTERDIDGS